MIKGTDSHRTFVFGSNLAGIHGKGAALHARKHYGALSGQGIGLQGNAYAIPTKNRELQALSIPSIKGAIDHFLRFVIKSTFREFNVTQIGCGLAGFTPGQIAPLFLEFTKADYPVWFDPTWEQWLKSCNTKYWKGPI